MNKEKRQMILQALKAAKPLVSRTYRIGRLYEYICHAIDAAYNRGSISSEARKLAKRMIMSRIGYQNYTANRWLESKIGREAIDAAPVDALQEWRHLWLDSLIEEFSK